MVLGGWDVDEQESEEKDTSRKKKWMVTKEEAIVNEDVGNGIVRIALVYHNDIYHCPNRMCHVTHPFKKYINKVFIK